MAESKRKQHYLLCLLAYLHLIFGELNKFVSRAISIYLLKITPLTLSINLLLSSLQTRTPPSHLTYKVGAACCLGRNWLGTRGLVNTEGVVWSMEKVLLKDTHRCQGLVSHWYPTRSERPLAQRVRQRTSFQERSQPRCGCRGSQTAA